MAGLKHCHDAKIAHRDLKPENLFIDKQFTLKIADFGFSGPVDGRDGSGKLTTKLGSASFMAPEIHQKEPYVPQSVDLFASAVILFMMVAKSQPFTTAKPHDPYFRCLAANRSDLFWKAHCKNKPNGDEFFSPEFKDLIVQLLKLKQAERL